MRFPSTLFAGCGALALMLALACGGSSTSSTTPPAIGTAPANATVKAGAQARFTVAASGDPAPTLAWERSGDAGNTWTAISGATSATYTFTAALADDSAQFRAKATSSAGTATSAAATLAVDYTSILVVGKYATASSSGVGFWKNDAWIELPLQSGATTADMDSIQVVGNDIYIRGSQRTVDYSSVFPGYWKNSAWVQLPPAGTYSSDLILSGSDVYVAGGAWDSSVKSYRPGYWKNGTWTALTDGNVTNMATSLFLAGNDLYVLGGYGYWKNGTRTASPGGNWLHRGSQSGNDVYIAGSTSVPGMGIAGYLKNGTWVALPLPAGTDLSFCDQILLAGGDLYALGYALDGNLSTNYYIPGYWKNGTWTPLPLAAGTVSAVPYSITLHRGEVFVGGFCKDSSGNTITGYWKNGAWVELAVPAGTTSACSYSLSLQ